MLLKIFPTLISVVENIISEEYNLKLIEKVNELEKIIPRGGKAWLTPVYNTFYTFDISKDIDFFPLVDTVTKKVNEYSIEMGSKAKMYVSESWFNSYYKHDYQEYHLHPNSLFSAVYFLKAPKGSSSLILQNPSHASKMFVSPIEVENDNNFNTWNIPAEQNKLVIFPSRISHMVPCHEIEEKRISIAFNFRCNL